MIASHPIAKSIQGGLAALSLISILPPVVEFDRIQILRFTHAIVFGWNEVIEVVGSYFGKLPYFFPLSSHTINLLIITASFQIPAFIKYRDKVLQSRPKVVDFFHDEECRSLLLLCLSLSLCLIILLSSLSTDYAVDALDLSSDFYHLKIYMGYSESIFWYIIPFSIHSISYLSFVYLYSQFFLCYSIFYLIQLRHYRDGLFLVLGFFSSMEILYIVNLPGLPHLVDEFACQFSRDFDLDCALPADANKAN